MTTIEIIGADITRQTTDAITNAANGQLRHGGGLARAIARAAGPELERASRQHPPIATGQAGWTPAGRLPCRYVIHAVGPVWRGGQAGEDDDLASAYRAALLLAVELDCRSLALPSISTGIYGFPLERAAAIALASVRQTLASTPSLELVRFCLFSDDDLSAYRRAAA